ncbi:MAG: hypothetical protein NT015_03680 [Alphaproteobacteria bacterium]|nr:hypothetical protein [Alphaproteobacteria bacterium]
MDVILPPDAPTIVRALFWGAAIGALFSIVATARYAAAQHRFKVRNYFRPHLLLAVGTALSCLAVVLLTAHWASHLGGVSNLGVAAGLSGVALQLLGALEMSRRGQPRSPAHFRDTKRALKEEAERPSAKKM